MIPKTLWMYWHDGYESAPDVVRRCIDSWIALNPGWDIRVLDERTTGRHISYLLPECRLDSLNQTKKSNLLRLQLLHRHGGVWADATTLCRKPLDDWLPHYSEAGFFVFHQPAPDRLLSTWFIAAERNCRLIGKWMTAYAHHFTGHAFRPATAATHRIESWLSRWLNRSTRTTRYWMSPFITRVLRIYPYFISHYLFERVVNSDPECLHQWNEMPRVPADLSHVILSAGYYAQTSRDTRMELLNNGAPVIKLTWKIDRERYIPGTLMHDIVNESDTSTREAGPPDALCASHRLDDRISG